MRAMLFSLLILAIGCRAEYVKMGEMNSRSTFVLHSAAPLDMSHELIFAVQQRNLDKLDNHIMERSDPSGAKYQQWMSFAEVGALTSNPSAASDIQSWLRANGITVSWTSAHQDYLKATATVEVWNSLLDMSLSLWKDSELVESDAGTKLFVRAAEYSIPTTLEGKVSAIFNTVQVPPVIHKSYHLKKNNRVKKTNLRLGELLEHNPSLLNEQDGPDVTLSFLNSYYSIPSNRGTAALNQSVFETSSESFSQSDLTKFQQMYGATVQKAIDIGGFETSACTFNTCGEGNLDIQYIMGISQVTSSIYWYVPGDDPFVAWVTDMADEVDPPRTNSMSWGAIEQSQSASVLSAFNTEAQKLALLGVTLLVSSGDDGVSNSGCYCTDNSGSSQSPSWSGTSWKGEGYFPNFPATNPYVTAVGATMFPTSVNGDKSDKPEIACQSQLGGVITSGGGFSSYWATPSWQANAVTTYFNGLTKQPFPGYNSNGRGIPDVAMLGVNFQVIIDGAVEPVYGTSCSAPLFAGVISLINAGRVLNGQTTVGFINPTLYAAAVKNAAGSYYNHYFNDVTSGDNACCANSYWPYVKTTCCNAGFNATRGWDPVTGWGSVNYANISALFPLTPPSPTKVPTFAPTPLPGYPTISPTVANVLKTTVTQQVSGTGVSATLWNNNSANSDSFVQAVQASIQNTVSVDVFSVINLQSSSAVVEGQKRTLASSAVQVTYYVTVNDGAAMSNQQAYDAIISQITSSVNSGNFTALMQSYAASNGAQMLTSATSQDVEVSVFFEAPTASPTKSPSSSVNAGLIAGIVVPIVVVLCCLGGYLYYRSRNSVLTPTVTEPINTNNPIQSEMTSRR